MKVKIAVVGLGIGKVHLKYYQEMPHVEIVGVVDTDGAMLKQVAHQHKVTPFFSVQALLESCRPDGVSICTPPSSHLRLTELFARHGVHILCEKPMAPTVSDCEKMIRVCDKNEVFLMLGFKKRFSPAYLYLKEKFAKEFGLPQWAWVRFALGRVEKKWFWDEKDGGGPITENAIHMVDLLRFLLGEVVSVFGYGGNFFMREFASQIDAGIFTLKFQKGAVAGIGAGYASEWGFATEEVALASARTVCEVRGPFDRPERLTYIYRSNPGKIYEKNFVQADGFAAEIKHFVECIRGNNRPAVTGEDGLYALKICQAMKTSVNRGQPVPILE